MQTVYATIGPRSTWGTNYCGTRAEPIQYIGHGGGAIALGDEPLPIEDAPATRVRQAGPVAST